MLRAELGLSAVLDGLKKIWLASDMSLLVGGVGSGAATVVLGLLVVVGGPLAFNL